MSDALSSNHASRTTLRIALCNAHGRRNFADLVVHFPEEAEAVLKRYQLIWQHDTEATEQQMTPMQRLAHHREHSLPLMEDIRRYGADRLAADAAEAVIPPKNRSAVSSCRSAIARTPCSSRASPVRPSTMLSPQ